LVVIVRPFVQRNERTERLGAPAANTLLVWLRRRAEAIRHAALDKKVRRLAQKRGVSQSAVIAEAVEASLDTSSHLDTSYLRRRHQGRTAAILRSIDDVV